MSPVNEMLGVCAVVAIQLVGLVSIAVAQFCERYWARALCQRSFFVCLLAVGSATVLAIYLGSANWLPCAATLGVMCVGGSFDIGARRRAVES